MTQEELWVRYSKVYRFIEEEKRARLHILEVWSNEPLTDTPITECDEALESLVAIKDFAKGHVGTEVIQKPLIELPETKRRGGY